MSADPPGRVSIVTAHSKGETKTASNANRAGGARPFVTRFVPSLGRFVCVGMTRNMPRLPAAQCLATCRLGRRRLKWVECFLSRQKFVDWIQQSKEGQLGMMEGPDMYQLLDHRRDNPVLVNIWQPIHLPDTIELVHVSKKGVGGDRTALIVIEPNHTDADVRNAISAQLTRFGLGVTVPDQLCFLLPSPEATPTAGQDGPKAAAVK
jgi:hypothetical protein